MSIEKIISIGSGIGSMTAGLAAVYAIWQTRKTFQEAQKDKSRDAILLQATESLKHAYDALTVDGTNIPPLQDRVAWLTSARHILRYYKLKNELDGIQHLLCEEKEEHWRHRFYLALQPLQLRGSFYDAPRESSENNRLLSIQHKSALVVLAFSDWEENKPDPLKEVRSADLLKGHENIRNIHPVFEHPLDELLASEERDRGLARAILKQTPNDGRKEPS